VSAVRERRPHPAGGRNVGLANVAGTRASPPAIWSAMVRQGQWKSWALVLAFVLCLLQLLVMLRLARREPDIVLISPDGKSTYLPRNQASEALLRFLDEQRQHPSDITVVHFTRTFLQHFLAINSTSYEASFREALAMLTPGLRERLVREAEASKLLEQVRASGTRAELEFEQLDILERSDMALQLRGVLLRRTESLADGAPVALERLHIELVESIVPRTAGHPDGLLIGHLSSRAEKLDPHSPPPALEPIPRAP
jgi:hypothetical protein